MRLVTGKRADTLLALMDRIESFTLARAWDDLTDDEFFWEPHAMAWSIRRQGQCPTPNPFGAGEWVADFAIPEPDPVPMTTIAWLYWHIGSMPGRLCDIDFLGGTRTGLHQRRRGRHRAARRLAQTPRGGRTGR
jgi:hypothetical protein